MATDRFKCVVVGDTYVGKTTMLRSYTAGHFVDSSINGVCIKSDFLMTMCVDDKTYSLLAWDTFAQPDYDKMRPLFYPETDGFIICFSLVNLESFEHVKSKWLPEIKNHSKNIPIVLVGTKLDLRESEAHQNELKNSNTASISHQQGRQLAKEIKAASYLECSSLSKQGLEQVLFKMSLSNSDTLDLWPEKRSSKNSRKDGRNAMHRHRQLINRPVIKKTCFASDNEELEEISHRTQSVEYSLNKDNRWKVIDKPWLLRDDAQDKDFRVVDHVITGKNKFMGENADVVQVYTDAQDEAKTKKTRGGSTTLKNITHVQKQNKKTDRKIEQREHETEELEINDVDTTSIQYDIYKVHTNPVMLSEKKRKGVKHLAKKRNDDMEDQMSEFYEDYEDEKEEFDDDTLHDEHACCSQSTSKDNIHLKETKITASKLGIVVTEDTKVKPMSKKALDEIRRLVFCYTNRNFPPCDEPHVEVNSTGMSQFDYYLWRYNKSRPTKYNQKKTIADLRPLWDYQLHIAKRDAQEVDDMQIKIQHQIEKIVNTSIDYVKLNFAKDQIEIVRHYFYAFTFLVRIIPVETSADRPLHQKIITNEEIHLAIEKIKRNTWDQYRNFADFFQYHDIIIQEKWDLSILESQLDPAVEFMFHRRAKMGHHGHLDFQGTILTAIRKAVDKTLHLIPIAVSFSSNSTDPFVDITIRQNWKQPNQATVYHRQLQFEQFTHKVHPFTIQFTIFLDKENV